MFFDIPTNVVDIWNIDLLDQASTSILCIRNIGAKWKTTWEYNLEHCNKGMKYRYRYWEWLNKEWKNHGENTGHK